MRNLLTDKFESSSFMEPDAFYWPGYMWMGALSKEELITHVRDMYEAGSRTVWILPMSKNFRPISMPTNMEPDVSTEEYWQIYEEVVKEIKRLDMVLWFNPEPMWPSGSA